jgi:hypothetical protein
MTPTREPRNPLYLLLLLISLLFVITALAYAVVPLLEQKALDAGTAVAPSVFRDSLRQDGWRWLLYELAGMTVVGLASMALDAWRQAKHERPEPKPALDSLPGTVKQDAERQRSS